MITRRAARNIRWGLRLGMMETELGLDLRFLTASHQGNAYPRLTEKAAYRARARQNKREYREG